MVHANAERYMIPWTPSRIWLETPGKKFELCLRLELVIGFLVLYLVGFNTGGNFRIENEWGFDGKYFVGGVLFRLSFRKRKLCRWSRVSGKESV